VDLLDWLGTLLRRWWLTVPLLVLALTATAFVAVTTPWTYKAQATGVLLGSPVQAKQAGGNPWLVFDSSLTVTAEVLGREMMDEKTAQSLADQGLTSTYQVGVAPDSSGPVLAIMVTGTDAADTKKTLDALIAMVPQKLTHLQTQESVSPKAQIKMNLISSSPKAAKVSTDKLRLIVMVLFMGLVLTVAGPLFAEVLSERRKRGRANGLDGPARRGVTARPRPRASGLPPAPNGSPVARSPRRTSMSEPDA
jgi:uncharacterized protein involved in exopolysaccharide biosynthesis